MSGPPSFHSGGRPVSVTFGPGSTIGEVISASGRARTREERAEVRARNDRRELWRLARLEAIAEAHAAAAAEAGRHVGRGRPDLAIARLQVGLAEVNAIAARVFPEDLELAAGRVLDQELRALGLDPTCKE